jgi:hypothetical protein
MFNPNNSLVRGAADEALRTVFPRGYDDLEQHQATLLITHLIAFANDQHIDNLYYAAEQLQGRMAPGTFPDYVAALAEHRDPATMRVHKDCGGGVTEARTDDASLMLCRNCGSSVGPDDIEDWPVAPPPDRTDRRAAPSVPITTEAKEAFSERREEIENRVTLAPEDRGFVKETGYTDAYGRATEYSPAEDDAYIHDRPSGGYDACMGERFLGSFDRRWQAERAITGEMQRSGFFPNVWLQDDHGGLTLLDATEADFGRNPDRVLHTHTVVGNLGLEDGDDLEVDL